MKLYDSVLNNTEYLELVKKIEDIKFITDGKWDWEHGFGHFKRVSQYVLKILTQLNTDSRTIDLGMTAALLHDIGLSKGDKVDHAICSSNMFTRFIDDTDITDDEIVILKQAIFDHSKGSNIQSLVGLSLVLADKLDVTYHRTVNSSIQDEVNKEIQKIKEVKIEINGSNLTVSYIADFDFDVDILRNWKKAITIPKKVSDYLHKDYIFLVNGQEVCYRDIIGGTKNDFDSRVTCDVKQKILKR